MKKVIGLLVLALAAIGMAQDKPEVIAKKDLPAKGVCVVCSAGGEGHGEENVAAGVKYKGKTYLFCNAKEVDAFSKEPDSFIPVEYPRPMYDFDLKDEAGKTWNKEAFKDKLVVLDFWATWCGPCIAIMPQVHKIAEKWSPKGVEVLSVSVDQDRKALDKFLGTHKFSNPVVHDTIKTFGKWNVKFIPTLFLVKDGQILGVYGGNELKKLEADIEKNIITK